MCEMSQLVLGGMAKGRELLQQLLHRGVGSRTLSLSFYYTLDVILIKKNSKVSYAHYRIASDSRPINCDCCRGLIMNQKWCLKLM